MEDNHTATSLLIKIGQIWGKGEGGTMEFTIDAPLEMEHADFTIASNVTAEVLLVKMKNEVSAMLSNIEVTIEGNCQRCLKKFTKKIAVDNAERQYLKEEPREEDDLMDVFLIDMEKLAIDLTEMLRQEIILHFPLIAVCSKSCKGLCQQCGANLNKKDCGHPQDIADLKKEEHRPFKNLKKLIK